MSQEQPISDTDIAAMTDTVFEAQSTATPIAMLSDDYPDLDINGAYRIQSRLCRAYQDAGHRLVGWKAGLTSLAKMQQMGVDEPTVGFLTNGMWAAEGSAIATSELVHPRVEPELAFVLGEDLAPDCTADEVVAATSYVLPAIEIIDSRYANFKFDLPSVIADNSSSARFVVGANPIRLDPLDRLNLGVVVMKNGQVISTGATAAVFGDPAAAVAKVAELVGSAGGKLERGMVVLSGGVTEASPVAPGDSVSVRIQDVGTVDVSFTS